MGNTYQVEVRLRNGLRRYFARGFVQLGSLDAKRYALVRVLCDESAQQFRLRFVRALVAPGPEVAVT